MDWKVFEEQFELESLETIEWLENEYAKIRTGRVNIAIFDSVRIEAYGETMKINQMANIQIVDATQVLIKPYDRATINDIAKGINAANIGINPQVNGDNIRISFPAQTEENRIRSVKKCKEILEQAKGKIRDTRKNVQNSFKKLTAISEDTIRFFEEELNRVTKEYNSNLEQVFLSKEKELLSF